MHNNRKINFIKIKTFPLCSISTLLSVLCTFNFNTINAFYHFINSFTAYNFLSFRPLDKFSIFIFFEEI